MLVNPSCAVSFIATLANAVEVEPAIVKPPVPGPRNVSGPPPVFYQDKLIWILKGQTTYTRRGRVLQSLHHLCNDLINMSTSHQNRQVDCRSICYCASLTNVFLDSVAWNTIVG